MKAILIYATNSGSTLEVSNHIAEIFKSKNIDLTVKDAGEIEPTDLKDYDLILLGSPTWGEGDVHDSFIALFDKAKELELSDKKIAIFGLGDSSYEHFCGAVDHLTRFASNLKAKVVADPLKINNYYFNQQDELPKIDTWVNNIITNNL